MFYQWQFVAKSLVGYIISVLYLYLLIYLFRMLTSIRDIEKY
jgi:hypothetical protein